MTPRTRPTTHLQLTSAPSHVTSLQLELTLSLIGGPIGLDFGLGLTLSPTPRQRFVQLTHLRLATLQLLSTSLLHSSKDPSRVKSSLKSRNTPTKRSPLLLDTDGTLLGTRVVTSSVVSVPPKVGLILLYLVTSGALLASFVEQSPIVLLIYPPKSIGVRKAITRLHGPDPPLKT